ncbi:DNA-binding response regulator, NarL/FixJ family, contains REC and HTH domains [Dyadobacter soli]|uniref:DNA-binding response regulator, NarL/FixJ family, contains REC and HTH domains n=1 Tax=Dyadobacter soli TaxID=659014 RepID=A0A1G6VSP6_9BACT|nr:response regulator transcription factor [Dyadobacter soli]SDD55846.1 DNA-binding response regulator, NarL/FixJ family, contains REC and HTH domains [Dyadobacter soli]
MDRPVIRTYLVHPHPLECAAVAEWLLKSTYVRLTGTSGSLDRFAQYMQPGTVEMVIVFHYCAAEIAGEIFAARKIHPRLKFLLAAPTSCLDAVRGAVHSGVHGYIDPVAEVDEWEWAIKSLSEGKTYYGQQVMQQLAEPFADQPPKETPPAVKNFLSKRELEVMQLVASEYSTNRIADQLFISEKTVETHRRNLFQKLGVKNSVGLTKVAVRLGIV